MNLKIFTNRKVGKPNMHGCPAFQQTGNLWIHHRIPEHLYYRSNRKRQNLHGLCLRHGSLQALLFSKVCAPPGFVTGLTGSQRQWYICCHSKKYTKPVLLILDEWLLLKLTESEARNLFELIHKRRKRSSTIFCSQFRESEWYQQICSGESTLADAIMDRISYDSYKIDIECIDPSKDLSMREVYGLDPTQAK